MYYHRRKCSHNVYLLEKSKERCSEPILKELSPSIENVKNWNTSIERIPEEKCPVSNSLMTLRVSSSTGFDWRRDLEQPSSPKAPRKSYNKPIQNDENVDPSESKFVEEQIRKLKAKLAEATEENKKIQQELITTQSRQKDL